MKIEQSSASAGLKLAELGKRHMNSLTEEQNGFLICWTLRDYSLGCGLFQNHVLDLLMLNINFGFRGTALTLCF